MSSVTQPPYILSLSSSHHYCHYHLQVQHRHYLCTLIYPLSCTCRSLYYNFADVNKYAAFCNRNIILVIWYKHDEYIRKGWWVHKSCLLVRTGHKAYNKFWYFPLEKFIWTPPYMSLLGWSDHAQHDNICVISFLPSILMTISSALEKCIYFVEHYV